MKKAKWKVGQKVYIKIDGKENFYTIIDINPHISYSLLSQSGKIEWDLEENLEEVNKRDNK